MRVYALLLFFLGGGILKAYSQNIKNSSGNDLEAIALNLTIVVMFVLGLVALMAYLQKRRANVLLEQQKALIEQQTRELAQKNEEFIQQNIELDRLGQERTSLIQLVSTDLKRQFMRISGITELIRLENQGAFTTEQQEYLFKMNELVRDSLHMIEHLTHNKQTLTVRRELHIERVDVEEIILQVIRRYKPYAAARQIRIEYQNDSQQSEFRTDDFFVARIFDHLLENAVKYSLPNSTVYVTLRDKANCFQLEVRDQGLAHHKKENEDTLGLAVIQSLIEEIGGRLLTEGDEKTGTTFTVEFLKKN